MALKGISLWHVALAAAGTILGVAAIRGQSLSDTVRNIIQGKSPMTGMQATAITVPNTGSGSGNTAPNPGTTPVPSPGGGGSRTANQAIARLLAAPFGWSVGTEWDDLVKLWDQESGWNNKAKNPSSGAYGIPQALPPTKMPFAAQEAGGSSATAQITWGLQYISSRYGSPSAAWAHEKANNWY